MINFNITGGVETRNVKLIGDESVRRILCYSIGNAPSTLLYKGTYIASFNVNNAIDIDFKSYYGFPKLSDFSVNVASNLIVSILVDTLPSTSVTDDYIERRPVS